MFHRPLSREDRGTSKPGIVALAGVEELFSNPAVRGARDGPPSIVILLPLVQLRQSFAEIPPPQLRLSGLPAQEPVVWSGGFVLEGFGGDGGEVFGGGFWNSAFFGPREDFTGARKDAFDLDGEGLSCLDKAWDFDEFGRLGGDLSVGSGGGAKAGEFYVRDTLP